jgi:class 3 adenylate cyclase
VLGVPETRYLKSGDVHLAYQVVGDGSRDLVFLSSWDMAIDFLWDEPSQVQFFSQLAGFRRLILFDKRGSGASDSVSLEAMPTLESWVDDVRAVMDVVGSEQADILACTFTGPLAVLFAATHPERTSALVLAHTYPRSRVAPDYPSGLSDEEVESSLAEIEQTWGTGDSLNFYAPSVAGDARLQAWWNRCARLSLSPATAAAFSRMMIDSDVRSILPSIQAPTLIVQPITRTDMILDAGRYMVEHIPTAKLLEVEGEDIVPWLTHGLADDIEEFLTGVRRQSDPDRFLTTVVFTDFVGSTRQAAQLGDRRWRRVLDEYEVLVDRLVTGYHGRRIKSTGDGTLATFDGPARAIRFAQTLAESVRDLGVRLRSGVHTGEIERRGDDIAGIAVHIGQRVSAVADADEVLVSRTVVDLVAGSGIARRTRSERRARNLAPLRSQPLTLPHMHNCRSALVTARDRALCADGYAPPRSGPHHADLHRHCLLGGNARCLGSTGAQP